MKLVGAFLTLIGTVLTFTAVIPARAERADSDAHSEYANARYFQNRYPLRDTHEKLVDNQGDGYVNLYGTRNVRAVLNGVVYRGGANNAYNKYGKRSNSNPLPNLGLENLCEEGFDSAIYLYSKNFSSAPKATNCRSQGATRSLPYSQHSPHSPEGIDAILKTVFAVLKSPRSGPVYLHCWNGWHASGLASAIILRQFCGMSASQAVEYWNLNTDGHNKDRGYEGIRNRIRNFQPRFDMKISAALQAEICPR